MLHTSQGSGCSPLPAAQTSPDPFRTLVRALVRRPGDYESMGCLPMCLCVCLYMCLYVSLIVHLCLWLAMHVYMCLLVCFHVSVCLSVSLSVVYMSVSLCVWESICVYLPVSMYRCGASLGLTLRGRGLPVHVYTPVSRLDQWYPVELSQVVGFVRPTKHHHTALPPNL